MKKLIRSITSLVVALCGVAISHAQTSIFTYQGRLNDGAAAGSGTYQMQFALFPGASGGSQIGSTITFDGTSQPAVQVTNGIFTVQLDFGSSPFNTGADRFLEISVKHPADPGYTTLAPRQQLTASPFSIRTISAGAADSLSSNCVGCVNDAQISGVDGSKVTGTVANATNSTNATNATSATTANNFSGNLAGDVTGTQSSTVVASVGGQTATTVAAGTLAANNASSTSTASTIVKRDASGNFAAGTITGNLSGNATTATSATTATTATNFSGSLSGDVTGTQSATVVGKLQGKTVASTAPATNQVLKFNGTQWAPGADSDTTYTAGNGLTLSATTFSANFAGNGSATTVSRSDHTHLGQTWTCNSTGCKGLLLETSDTDVNSAGLYGQVNSATGQGTGVWGSTFSTSSQSSGVFGQASTSTAGASAKGVWAEADGPTGIALYAQGLNGSSAALFQGNAQVNGNLFVNGTLSKSAGSFKIDHPIDPDNKYLSHSFVESPDMMNIYNGNVVTDGNGDAIVTMPGWFQALNRDFRYQLTVIRQFAQAIVAEEISGNQFRIKTDKPNVEVSWQVTGIRHDKYAEDHRIPVEEDKKAEDKGKCLYAPACESNTPIMEPATMPRGIR